MRSRDLLAISTITLSLAVFACKPKEEVVAPVDDSCRGATCVEEAEAALWEGNAAAAMEPLRKSCEPEDDKGDAISCFNLAGLYYDGKGGEKSIEKSAKYFELACELTHEEACERRYELARKDGVGDDEVAMTYALKACEGGRRLGCMGAAEIERARMGEDKLKAAELYEKACALGEADGCAWAGDLLFNPDPKSNFEYKARALTAYNSACVGYNGHGCLRLALCMYHGIGTNPSVERARDQFKNACELGVEDGCVNQKRIDAAKGGDVTLRLTTERDELVANGVEAHEISCNMDEFGDEGLRGSLAAIARHKGKLNKCLKEDGAAVGIRWTFEDGRVKEVRGNGKGAKRYVGCVAKALKKKSVPGTGKCSGILLLGDQDVARAALPPKQPKPDATTPAVDKPPEKGVLKARSRVVIKPQ
ncbi:MAG: sel1 repeat family protein [Myxococcales bacterium]|nr:sel1 repeat family protein [Myxococcales bacterium]MCB9755736.1 sel1 repeat family protein [Myxococcales bacterium]